MVYTSAIHIKHGYQPTLNTCTDKQGYNSTWKRGHEQMDWQPSRDVKQKWRQCKYAM